MGVGIGVLMMTVRRRGVGKGAARRHESQRHIHADDSECEASDSGVGGSSVHGLKVLTWPIKYAVPQKLSTDGCSWLLQLLRGKPQQHLDRPLSECVDDLDAGRPCGGHEAPDDSHAGGKQ